MQYQAGHIQIAVVGAGHAGVEAALAAARLGCSTMLFTLSLDAVANMPCNPWAGRWARPPIKPFCKAGCSTGEKARLSIPSGHRLTGGPIWNI